jgi:HK97 family phage prohead protease
MIERRPGASRTDPRAIVPDRFIERWGLPPKDNPEAFRAYMVRALKAEPGNHVHRLISEADRMLERRSAPAAETAAVDGVGSPVKGPTRIEGLAVPFAGHGYSADLGGFVEEFARSAFRDQERDKFGGVLGQWMHNREEPIAKTPHTMTVTTAGSGVRYSMRPIGARGRNVIELSAAGVATGASVGFVLEEDEWSLIGSGSDDMPLRTVTRATLKEISVVTQGAYPQATAEARFVRQPEGRLMRFGNRYLTVGRRR